MTGRLWRSCAWQLSSALAAAAWPPVTVQASEPAILLGLSAAGGLSVKPVDLDKLPLAQGLQGIVVAAPGEERERSL